MMFSLPNLAPQDSYSLWYTPSTATHPSQFIDSSSPNDPINPNPSAQNASTQTLRRHVAPHRTPLARLRQDEEYMERRKLNIQNYGNSWLKPPGVPKTLYQQREEKREMEEHQEALRREQLAQELAEAEAEAAMEGMGDEGVEEDEGRDLDDDIPDADNTNLSLMDDEDEDEENEPSGDLSRLGAQVRGRNAGATTVGAAARLPARVPDDVYREALARGEDHAPGGFGDDGASTIDEEAQEGMLQEEDLQPEEPLDLDMDGDLDADIPDADEASGYEHTDTDELSSSSDDESVDAGLLPARRNNPTTSMIRSDGTQTSMDLSSLISAGGSSQVGSSPRLQDVSGRRRPQ